MRRATQLVIVASLALTVILYAALVRRTPERHDPRAPVAEPLPFEAARLPPEVTSLHRSEPDAEEPDQARWSRLAAALCGGHDVYAAAIEAAESGDDGRLRRQLAAPPGELARALACGKAFAPDPRREHAVGFRTGADLHSVSVLRTALEAPPPTSDRFRAIAIGAPLEHAACADDCQPTSAARARVAGTDRWLYGDLEDVRAFGSELDKAKEATHRQRVVEQLAMALRRHRHVDIGDARLLPSVVVARLVVEPPLMVHLSGEHRALQEALERGLDGYGIGHDGEPDGGRVRVLMLAKSDAEAERVAGLAKAWLAAAVSRLRGEQPPLAPRAAEPAEVLAHRQARASAHRRAWRQLAVSRDGRRVALSTTTRLGDDELLAYAAYLAWRDRQEKQAAELVDSLMAGRPVQPPPRGESVRPTPRTFEHPKPAQGDVYTPDDLRRLGLTIEKIDDRRSLLCGFEPSRCICLEPLPCEAAGDCITLERNLAVFEKAPVSCESAETGRCGEFSYFRFDGDIHRHELRWFDAKGKLVGQLDWTDYAAYCDRKSAARWQGKIPWCKQAERERLVCGKPASALVVPLEALRIELATAFEPAR